MQVTQKLLKVLVFFLSPPGQSEGGARRDPGEWGRGSPGSASRVPRDRRSASGGPFAPRGGLHPATQGLTRFGHRRTAQHKAGRPGLVGRCSLPLPPLRAGAQPPRRWSPQSAFSIRTRTLRTSGALALSSSTEQLHNDTSVRGAGPPLVLLQSASAATREY